MTKSARHPSCIIERRGDAITQDQAFEELFRQYEQPVCSYLARLTGDLGRAQELTQETFLRAYQALCGGEQWNNPRAWLFRVASHLATDEHRRRRLLRWFALRDEQPDPAPGVAEATAEQMAVQLALSALPPKYRLPLVLYAYAERSVAEIGQILGLRQSAVKMRLSRARKMFRQVYQGQNRQGQEQVD